MVCKICSNKTHKVFSKIILGKHDVNYYQCQNCYFLQTENPYWLKEAYNTGAISALDTGILSRNILLRDRTKKILHEIFSDLSGFYGLDYGGGEGIFVRMMRDLGFNFYRQDLYATNLYARFFDMEDLPKGSQFKILTAFEVFEHLNNPILEIKKMFEYSNILLFSTELQPSKNKKDLEDWWYIVPEAGQHISFFTESSLQKIAKSLNCNFYTDHINLHIFSKKALVKDPFKEEIVQIPKKNLLLRALNRFHFKLNKSKNKTNINTLDELFSLTMHDFELVKNILNKKTSS